MKLPPSIEQEIVDYLRLEFGDADDPASITASQLQYVGSRKQGRADVHFWVFKSGHRRRWATAALTKSGYSLGTSDEGPDGESDMGAVPDAVYIDFEPATEGGKAVESIRLPIPGEGVNGGMSAEIPVTLPSGGTFGFFVEVFLPTPEEESLDVSMEVSREGEPVFYLRCRCTTGMIFQCNLGGYNWSIQVGTGPWS